MNDYPSLATLTGIVLDRRSAWAPWFLNRERNVSAWASSPRAERDVAESLPPELAWLWLEPAESRLRAGVGRDSLALTWLVGELAGTIIATDLAITSVERVKNLGALGVVLLEKLEGAARQVCQMIAANGGMNRMQFYVWKLKGQDMVAQLRDQVEGQGNG